MDFFHLNIGHISRSSGRSTVQNVAYITGEKLHEERRNKPADYANNRGKTTWATMAPLGSGIGEKDLSIWNKLENFEDYYARERFKNPEILERYLSHARTGHTYELALPVKLTSAQNESLVRDIIAERFVDKGLVATYAINWNEGNPHVHITVSNRTVWDGEISWYKTVARQLTSRFEFRESRRIFADVVNKHLELAALLDRVDHRSYADRGIELIPTLHKGYIAHQLEKEGFFSRIGADNAQISEENKERIAQYPRIILQELTSKQATFRERDVVQLVQKRFQGEESNLTHHVIYSVLKEAVEVGIGFDDFKRYTSKDYKVKEDQILSSLDTYHNETAAISISKDRIKELLEGEASWLKDGQKEAIKTLCGDSQFSILIGRAGTGKTTALQYVVQLHKEAGYGVWGMAPSATAAQELQKGAGCRSDTIAHYAYHWKSYHEAVAKLEQATTQEDKEHWEEVVEKRQAHLPHDKTLILVDEAGMVGVGGSEGNIAGGWDALIRIVNLTGCKLMVVGDDHQFKPVEAGDVFRKVIEMVRTKGGNLCELIDIQRQRIPWMKEASHHLAGLQTTVALGMYESQGHVQEFETNQDIYEVMANQYLRNIIRAPDSQNLVLAYTNEEVLGLNGAIRKILKENDLLASEDMIQGPGNPGYTVGDKIVFTLNDRGFWTKFKSPDPTFFVRNGTQGIIKSIKPCRVEDRDTSEIHNTYKIVVRVDEGMENPSKTKPTTVSFYLSEYSSFQHGYAMTTHKSQGGTSDGSLTKVSRYMDAYALYVALTRHRDDMNIYYSKEDFADFQDLLNTVGKLSAKDLAVDYSVLEENHGYWMNIQDYKALGYELASVRAFGKGADRDDKSEQDRIWTNYANIKEERIGLAKLILEEWDTHANFARQAGLSRESIEIAAGLKQRPISRLEEQAQLVAEQYVSIAHEAREKWRTIRRTHPGSRAKTHPEWQSYENLRDQRGALASRICQDPILYRPFLKNVGKIIEDSEGKTKQIGYGMHIIKAQAEAYQSKVYQQDILKNTKDPAVVGKLTTLIHYMEARDLYAALWKDLKPKLKHVEGTLLTSGFNKDIDDLMASGNIRNQLALKIVDAWEEYQPLIHKFNIKLDYDKLFDQKEQAIQETLLQTYITTQDQISKVQAAFELKTLMDKESEQGKKITVAQSYQWGLQPKEIVQHAREYLKIKILESLTTEAERQLFASLDKYDQKYQEANQVYVKCLEDIAERNSNVDKEENNLKPSDSLHYLTYKEVVSDRNGAAYELANAANLLEFLEMVEQKGLIMNREVLITHAQDGYREQAILQYQELSNLTPTKDELSKAKLAEHLQLMIRDDQAEGHKKTLLALYQAQLNPKDILANAKDYAEFRVFQALETEEEREAFGLVIQYKMRSTKVNELYRQCAEEREELNIKIEDNPLYSSYIEAIKERGDSATALLGRISLDLCHSLAESLGIRLDEDKLHAQSQQGARQASIDQYLNTDSILVKCLVARELKDMMDKDQADDQKGTIADLYRNKISLQDIQSQAKQFDRITAYAQLTSDEERQVYSLLERYDDLHTQIKAHYKACCQEAENQDIKKEETASYHLFQETLKERHELASVIQQKERPHIVANIAEDMGISKSMLNKDSHSHEIGVINRIRLEEQTLTTCPTARADTKDIGLAVKEFVSLTETYEKLHWKDPKRKEIRDTLDKLVTTHWQDEAFVSKIKNSGSELAARKIKVEIHLQEVELSHSRHQLDR